MGAKLLKFYELRNNFEDLFSKLLQFIIKKVHFVTNYSKTNGECCE